MSLKYSLSEALLTSSPNDYQARAEDVKSHDLASITERMVQKGTTVTRTDTIAVLNAFFEVLTEITKNGEAINLELFKTHFSIQGLFHGATDSFDPKRHHIKINMHAGARLKKVLENLPLTKTAPTETLPHILEVRNITDGSINGRITTKGVVEIIGNLLKVDGPNKQNGVYFVAADKSEHKVQTIIEKKPARLIAMVPDMPKGPYTLEVRTQCTTGNSLIKNTRAGVFTHTLQAS